MDRIFRDWNEIEFELNVECPVENGRWRGGDAVKRGKFGAVTPLFVSQKIFL